MRVIQLIDSLEAGGAERVALNYANSLNDCIDKSFLCTTRKEGVLKQGIANGVGYLFLQRKRVVDLKAIKTLRHYIRTNKITIMHAHASSFFLAGLVKLSMPSLKLVWHEHYGNRNQVSKFQNLILKIASLLFNKVIVVSEKLKLWSNANLYIKDAIYLPNYVLKTKEKKETFLYGVEGKRIVILANLRPDKDHLNLLEAFLIVKKKYSDWTLHIIGKMHDDAYTISVQRYVKVQALENHVFFYKSCKDIYHILSQATIGVLASKSEGLPLSLLEYGLAGLPVVVTNVGYCADVVSHKTNGLVVTPQSAIDLSKGLEALITNNDIRRIYGEQLKKRVQHLYAEKAVIAKLLNLYKAL
jgi:glycosyltransferase involved in cell wall biosynthesis